MLILGLDTAGEQGSVGVTREDSHISEIAFPAALKQGEKLPQALDMSLKLAEIQRDELELIAVSMGPGSFTGLRIGIAMAKGLARALEIPLVGVLACEAYARTAAFWEGPVWVILSDRRDWIYYGSYQRGKQCRPLQAASIETLTEAVHLSLTSDHQGEKTLFIGPGAEQYRERLARSFDPGVVAPALLNRPSGLQIARLGWEKYHSSARDELYDLEPSYLQAPLAEPRYESMNIR